MTTRSENLLQTKLEQWAEGRSLSDCQAELPPAEADLLALAAQLGQMAQDPDPQVCAVQRARLIRLARKEFDMQIPSRTSQRYLPRWLGPTVAVAAGVTLLFMCVVLVLVLGLGGLGLWYANRTHSPQVAQHATVWPTSTAVSVSVTPRPGALTTATPSPAGPTPSGSVAVVPASAPPLQVPDALSAVLGHVRGLVQVQDADGNWVDVPAAGQVIQAGARIRTAALSGVELIFYDGSVASLDADSELSVDQLDARTDGPRVVVLTLYQGDTSHEVVPSQVAGSSYLVHTPSGSGAAQGTVFQVRVRPRQVWFSVDQGVVSVTHLQVTVIVIAGQITTVAPDAPPTQPSMRISGQGRVEQTGSTWIIVGQSFQLTDHTILIGNPGPGDWVQVEGHLLADQTRVADVIALISSAATERFTIQGEVQTISPQVWVVAGQTISISAETWIGGGIVVGDQVLVQGEIVEHGGLAARQITRLQSGANLPFEFTGVVQEMGESVWVISNISITVNAQTVIAAGLNGGDLVRVQGAIQDDGAWLAAQIQRAQDRRYFEFGGVVQSMEPWIVSGIALTTTGWTEIASGIEVGSQVQVQGYILADGSWLAEEIRLVQPPLPWADIVFVGRVSHIEPWIIGGISLTVNSQTEIQGHVRLGVRARVHVTLLSDGTWLARRIKAIGMARGQGCLNWGGIVAAVTAGQVRLRDGQVVLLPGLVVQGQVVVHSVVLIYGCVDENGQIVLLQLIVIGLADPAVVPIPAVQPTALPQPEGDVVICHKPGQSQQTMTVSRSALQAHLDHGDTLGPCPDRNDKGGEKDKN